MTETIAAINTAPAAMSFIFPISGCCAGEIKSAINSTAVFNNSAEKTKPIHKTSIIHSVVEIFKIKPAPITIIVATRWIFMFNSFTSPILIPLSACWIEAKNLFTKCFVMSGCGSFFFHNFLCYSWDIKKKELLFRVNSFPHHIGIFIHY